MSDVPSFQDRHMLDMAYFFLFRSIGKVIIIIFIYYY